MLRAVAGRTADAARRGARLGRWCGLLFRTMVVAVLLGASIWYWAGWTTVQGNRGVQWASPDLPTWLWSIVVFSAALIVGAWRVRGSSAVPGRCPRCGYDLTGNVSGRCPECGEPILQKKDKNR